MSGGTGTGKTWHALEQACRYASEDGGKRVLLLVYNLALTNQLERLVSMRRLEKGEVRVMGWESLFRSLVVLSGGSVPALPSNPTSEEASRFYQITLPGMVLHCSRKPEGRARWPRFDALVVDEAQDHDTDFDPEVPGADGALGGWWHIYRLLLAEGGDSRLSAFFDRTQRPPFRDAARFDPGKIAALFSQPAWFRLRPAVRYTRNLWSFLTSHRAPAIEAMIDALGDGGNLLEGPEPEVHSVDVTTATVVAAVEAIILRWQREGYCEPREVLILHRQAMIDRSPLGSIRVLCGRWNLRDCQEADIPAEAIRHSSINKAKGLDSKAVIVVGLPSFERISDTFEHYMWFMATSRARQLLAMVHSTPG